MPDECYKGAYALFMDESGHDHKIMPYEVRGGIALPVNRLLSFVMGMSALEYDAFGTQLHKFNTEIKGHKLLDKNRFEWAGQNAQLSDHDRMRHARGFLERGVTGQKPRRIEFTAYGQACLLAARNIFGLLIDYEAKLFAAAIPRGAKKTGTRQEDHFLRKDQVFLLERYYYFLEDREALGLIVADETDSTLDRRFFSRLQSYFTRTHTGEQRLARIVPVPLFVASDMSYPIQAADVCIYCLNWGFRLPSRGMNSPKREDIAADFGPLINKLQFHCRVSRPGEVFDTHSIFYVPDPYTRRL